MWQTKRNKVADASANEMKLETASVSSSTTTSSGRSSRRKNSGGKRADHQLREFFNNIGSSVVEFIDATPLGVPTPAPWSPSTDKKKALLSNPISVWNSVSQTHANFFGGAMEGGSAWMLASSQMLINLREGLANAVLAEKAMGEGVEEEVNFEGKMVTIDIPVVVDPVVGAIVSSEAGCESFVDLGADRWGNSSRKVNPVNEAVSEAKAAKKVAVNKILTFIDRFTLRKNGIVVTSDDCSVECSLDSLVEACSPSSSPPGSIPCDEDDFEDCPSVITELAIDDLEDTKEDTQVVPAEVEVVEEEQVSVKDLTEGEVDNEYVMAEDLDSDEESFVDVRAESGIAYHP
eukprot:CAMPEP_0201599434 /NCGR_PEP_ID=MMETSP0492-20130828/884_1 /ASSEMBLY_ACC=CAM_ASM_000837 /TAXON_ID=420259 /ORGANISM="Thalassiosira gravida, Strain GMp14c1" /LENGTH=346 /DNA_ID=CAMNT_0048062005 /DNA_START=49 /DNA_END=1089 /DNA_ORIENTATION=-